MNKIILKNKRIISLFLAISILFANISVSHASLTLVGGSALAAKGISTISLSIAATYFTSNLLESCNLSLYNNNDTIKSIVDNINNNYEYDSNGNIALKENASGIDGSKIENGVLYVPYNSSIRNSARGTIRENFDVNSKLVATNSAEEYIITNYYDESTGLYSGYKYAYYLVANCTVTNRDYDQILYVMLTDRPDFVFYCYGSGYGKIYPCYYASTLYPCRVVSVYSSGSTDAFDKYNWGTTSSSYGCTNFQGDFLSFGDILSCNTSVIDTGYVGYNDATNNFKTPFSELLKNETSDALVGLQAGTSIDADYPNVNEDEEEDESIDWFPIPPEDYSIDNYTGKTYDELIKDINDTYGNTSSDSPSDDTTTDTEDKGILDILKSIWDWIKNFFTKLGELLKSLFIPNELQWEEITADNLALKDTLNSKFPFVTWFKTQLENINLSVQPYDFLVIKIPSVWYFWGNTEEITYYNVSDAYEPYRIQMRSLLALLVYGCGAVYLVKYFIRYGQTQALDDATKESDGK